jgi:ribose/xylose/arabinose/galactoside ABC-type transport system permease subunit
MNTSPNIEKISKVLLILFIIGFLGNYFFSNTLSSYLSLQDIGQYKLHLHIISIAQTVVLLLINIALGIWLYKKAPSYKWGWMLLAFVFGINAVIVFYLNHIMTTLSKKEKVNLLK